VTENASGTIQADVAVVGGGLIGCSIARELSIRGLDVVLVERQRPGAEASSAAAGLLAPQSEAARPDPFFDLALESRSLYPSWIAELTAETGLETGYRQCGILRFSFQGDPWDEFGWQASAGHSVEVLGPEAIASRTQRRAAPAIRKALFFDQDAIVDSARLTEAVALSAERRGVRVLGETAVRRFLVEGGACRGVETDRGRVEAPRVVNAAGAWAGFDRGLPFQIPVQPVRGQMVELMLAGSDLPTVVQSDDVYLVPRPGGSVLAGATVEHVGFRKEVTAAGVAGIVSAAIAVLPDLGGAQFVRAWAGLRPGTPDGWPILGPSPLAGLFLATGHFRNGILLAPVTALRLADAVIGAASPDFSAFAVERFSSAFMSPVPAP
jgi:glycine oxidase